VFPPVQHELEDAREAQKAAKMLQRAEMAKVCGAVVAIISQKLLLICWRLMWWKGSSVCSWAGQNTVQGSGGFGII